MNEETRGPVDAGRRGASRPVSQPLPETLPNGMLPPGKYAVWRGRWYRAARLRKGFITLFHEAAPPGPEWTSISAKDERGGHASWTLEIAEYEVDRFVRLAVTATWHGNKIGIARYADGVVHARVEPHPAQEAKIDRGEIPEIVKADRIEYHGTFRWEDLEDIQMVEKDLKK